MIREVGLFGMYLLYSVLDAYISGYISGYISWYIY